MGIMKMFIHLKRGVNYEAAIPPLANCNFYSPGCLTGLQLESARRALFLGHPHPTYAYAGAFAANHNRDGPASGERNCATTVVDYLL